MQRGGKGESVIKLLYCLYIPLKEAAVFHRVYKKRIEGLEPAIQAEGEEKTEARDEFISGMELGSQENIQERYVFIFIHKINACLRWKYLQADIERGTTNCEEIEDDFGVPRSRLPCKIHLTVPLENNISLIFLI